MTLTIANIARSVGETMSRFDSEDSDRWSRIRMIARAIPADADLDDESDVIRALFTARLCSKDFDDVLESAIEQARENREGAKP